MGVGRPELGGPGLKEKLNQQKHLKLFEIEDWNEGDPGLRL